MVAYANLHLVCEQMRIRARQAERGATPEPEETIEDAGYEPPRVLVIGPEHSGKTTACKILATYAVRGISACTPLYINLDPNEGGFTIPGTLSACPIDSPIPTSSPANPLGITATSAPTALSSSKLIPLVHWYGHSDIKKNPRLVEHLIRVLSDEVHERLETDVLARTSGLFIDTPHNFTSAPLDDKYVLVKAAVAAFQVNMIIVIGNEKLTVEMQKLFAESPDESRKMTVLKIPRSAGVVELDASYRDRVQGYQLKNYFFGSPLQLPEELSNQPLSALKLGGEAAMDLTLSPHSSVISFDDLNIYRIGQDSFAPTSALPIGASRRLGELKPTRIDPSLPGSGIVNSILAMLSLTEVPSAEEEIVDADVVGFIVITAMDMENKKMTILTPSATNVTGRIAITGSFQWQDV